MIVVSVFGGIVENAHCELAERESRVVTSCFQTNLDSVYSTMMVAFVYGGIVEDASYSVCLTSSYWLII